MSPSRFLIHRPEPMPAFDAIMACSVEHGDGIRHDVCFALTATYGIDYRIINGRVDITAHAVTEPDKNSRRTGEFNKRASNYFEKRRL